MQESNLFALNNLTNSHSIADEIPLELGGRTRSKSASGSIMMQIDDESDSKMNQHGTHKLNRIEAQ